MDVGTAVGVGGCVGVAVGFAAWHVIRRLRLYLARLERRGSLSLSDFFRKPNISYLAFLLLSAFTLVFLWAQNQLRLFEELDAPLGAVYRISAVSHPVSVFAGWFFFALTLWFSRKILIPEITRDL